MWSQLIFFAAVALLIVLLLRRGAASGKVLSTLGAFFQGLGSVALGGLRRMFGSIVGLFGGRASRRQPNSPFLRENVNQQFWQESAVVDKLGDDSNYEEGERLYKSGDHQKAERFFLKAAANHPGDAKIYARLGLLYLQTKSYSDAIEALKVAVKLDKYNPSRHYNLALAYTGNKDIQKAISSVREAITLDPVTQKYRQLLEQLLNS